MGGFDEGLVSDAWGAVELAEGDVGGETLKEGVGGAGDTGELGDDAGVEADVWLDLLEDVVAESSLGDEAVLVAEGVLERDSEGLRPSDERVGL